MDYKKLILKGYKHFTLYLHQDQRYLGRSYAWLNRDGDMQLLSQFSEDEVRELHGVVLKEYEQAIKELWSFDLMNYAWLGNHVHAHGGHGHMHLIPRYQEPRSFGGEVYVDNRWGKNYAPYAPWNTSEEDLCAIRDAIRAKLP